MITINRILCPVDFFPASGAAVTYAKNLASKYSARIHLLHVIAPVLPANHEFAFDIVEITKQLEEAARTRMTALAERAKAAGVPCDIETRVGDVYDEIKKAIEAEKPEFVVMGTHGRRGFERWFMGSTTEKLLRHSPVPLLTINASGESSAETQGSSGFRRILVTTDFSAGTPDALAYAFSVARENESQITLLHVVQDDVADLSGRYRDSLFRDVEKRLHDRVPAEREISCQVNTRIETGVPYRVILKLLEDEKIDLLVMNVHGKGMVERALVGSTAERAVRAASCPVMLIPPIKRKLKRRARPGGSYAA